MERTVMEQKKKEEETFTFLGTIRRESEKAVLFEFEDADGVLLGEHWLPKSKIINLVASNNVGGDVIVIPGWIARDRKLV